MSRISAVLACGILCLALVLAGSTPAAADRDLNGAQNAFSTAFAYLILYAQDMGYTVSIGRCQDFQADKRSLHYNKLACDLHLFRRGKYLKDTAHYRHLGKWWIAYGRNTNIPLEWGGSGRRADGNHFSLAIDGTRW